MKLYILIEIINQSRLSPVSGCSLHACARCVGRRAPLFKCEFDKNNKAKRLCLDFTFIFKLSRLAGPYVARRDNWGGGGGYIHIFMFTYRTVKTIAFKRNPSGRTRIYEYAPPPNYRSSCGPVDWFAENTIYVNEIG